MFCKVAVITTLIAVYLGAIVGATIAFFSVLGDKDMRLFDKAFEAMGYGGMVLALGAVYLFSFDFR